MALYLAGNGFITNMDTEKYWDANWEKAGRLPVSNFAKRCYSQIEKKNYTTLLDIGCGNGKDSLYFASKGIRVTSVDFSGTAIEQLKRSIVKRGYSNIQAIKTDIIYLDLHDDVFDVIYANLSLQYFNDEITTQIFDKLFKCLKTGGMIFVKCKSTDDNLYGKGKRIGRDMFLHGHIRHFFNKEYMSEKLERFDILKIRKTSSYYFGNKSCFIEAVATK